MNTTRKGSKNSIENRGHSSEMVCNTCGQSRKPFRLVGSGKTRMAYECQCGLVNRFGNKI